MKLVARVTVIRAVIDRSLSSIVVARPGHKLCLARGNGDQKLIHLT